MKITCQFFSPNTHIYIKSFILENWALSAYLLTYINIDVIPRFAVLLIGV